jgi:alcohol dehydrogenase class IV
MRKFALNTNVLMGEGICSQIGAQAELLGARNILLVTDEGLEKAGVVDKVLQHIDSAPLKVTVFSEVKPDPTVKVVDQGASVAKEKGCDLIVAVGGGSPIDAAKAIAIVVPNGGSCTDYEGMDQYKRPPLPLFAIPTTCGTGSEVTFGAVLTDSNTNYKFIVYGYNCAPEVAFLDPTLVVGIPKNVLAPTGMDALTHAVESYVSKGATPQSRPMSLEAMRMISENFRRAIKDSGDVEAVTNMLYAANIAGIAFACTRLGIIHAMALPLGAFFHVPHGIANSILLPHGLDYNLGYDNLGYCDMAVAMGEDLSGRSEEEGARTFVDMIKQIAVDVGVPGRLTDVGVTEDKIDDMARDTMKSSHIPVNPRPIRQEEVEDLYRKAM